VENVDDRGVYDTNKGVYHEATDVEYERSSVQDIEARGIEGEPLISNETFTPS